MPGAEGAPRDAVLWEGKLLPFLADVSAAGGSWEALSDTTVWEVSLAPLAESVVDRVCREFPGAKFDRGLQADAMMHSEGLFRVILEGINAVIWSGRRFAPDPRARVEVILIMARDREEGLRLLHLILDRRTRPRLRLWGGGASSAFPAVVAEAEVIMPVGLKAEMLRELDHFWDLATLAQTEGLVARRGLLMVGPPGTGKTQLVRHLIARYPSVDAHLFVPGRHAPAHDPFGEMLAHLRIAKRPAMVVLEDIDRLEQSGTVTAGYLLNCLDGLLENPVPTLWVATSNDPGRLDDNLLSRPGRFDRTIVFELPSKALREQLIQLHASEKVDAATVAEAAQRSEGMGGAHIREVCIAARLAVLESGGPFGARLLEQVHRVHRQHQRSREFGRRLASGRVGFLGE